MHLTVFYRSGICSLSLRERAGVRVPKLRKKPLTLTFSLGERGKKGSVKINETMP